MRIFRSIPDIPAAYTQAALAIGNFDGVHLGHQALLHHAVNHAQQQNIPAIVMTFHPHPRLFFSKSNEPRAIDPFHIKCRRIKSFGVDAMVVLPFNAAFAAMSAEAFIQRILIDALAVRSITVGHDFHFGYKRAGTVAMLRDAGFLVHSVGAQHIDNQVIASSAIRQALSRGDMAQANAMLGRPYQIYGRVQHGDKRGRTLNAPTANIAFATNLHPPAHGVYAVQYAFIPHADCAKHSPIWQEGIANFGISPTFGGTTPRLELHAFAPCGDVYGQYARVRLLHFIRPEVRFTDAEALKAQISADIAIAKQCHLNYAGA
jgi:riboflavin kinase / FMN adenylyltransferase